MFEFGAGVESCVPKGFMMDMRWDENMNSDWFKRAENENLLN